LAEVKVTTFEPTARWRFTKPRNKAFFAFQATIQTRGSNKAQSTKKLMLPLLPEGARATRVDDQENHAKDRTPPPMPNDKLLPGSTTQERTPSRLPSPDASFGA